ncbi:duf221 family protein [Moniliophthora roreri]|uniref:DUF221-domain-containing protein n=1 Tax=Moniliophthora roreri TaxID=221103 RepID=A0A0W0FGG9_MONRR|nr:duf221 family protein [Moniliophthora roreri]
MSDNGNDPTLETAESASTASFVTALVFNSAVFGIQILAFTLLRPYFRAIYEPRTYAPPKSLRSSPLVPSPGGSAPSKNPFRNLNPPSLLSTFSWPFYVFKSDYRDIKKANGLDAYFFVRFLRFMSILFLPIWFISWAVLLPVTSVRSRQPGNEGLDLFVFGNVTADKQTRLAAHIILVYLFTFWTWYLIKKEYRHFIVTRQRHLISPEYASSVQANTVLITGIPLRYLKQSALRKTFEELPGGVKQIWVNRDLKNLPEIYERRQAAEKKLESAETKLLSIAAKNKLAAEKKNKKGGTDPEANVSYAEVPKEQRPTHKLGFLGLFGEKVDTIEWCRDEIRVCTELLETERSKVPGYRRTRRRRERTESFHFEDDSGSEDDFGGQGGFIAVAGKVGAVGEKVGGKVLRRKTRKEARPSAEGEQARPSEEVREEAAAEPKEGTEPYPPLSSAFITFNKQVAAHLAAQALVHHEPYRMTGKHLALSPTDVIWSNLGLNPYEMKVRSVISWAATIGLIVLWATPVAFVGSLSNINAVCERFSWLNWICTLPDVVKGIISGILPPVLLAILMMLLPIVLRLLAKFEGIPKRSGVELSLMTRFFIFQVIHGFLIVTLASGIISSLKDLSQDTTKIPNLLAMNLPKASNFFLTYVILQGLSGTAGGFLQIVPLVIYYVKLFILGSTPRAVYGIKYVMRSVAWGTLWPGITLLSVIALGYSVISPIINGLACFTFFAFYLMYKYLFLYAYQQDISTDTGGLFFPKAIQHLFVGMYICLAALFFLARDENGDPSAVPQGALTVALIIFTAFFHILMNNSYGPLIHALPLTLVEKMYVSPEDDDEPLTPSSRSNSHAEESSDSKKIDSIEMERRQRGPPSVDTRGPSTDGNAIATSDDVPLKTGKPSTSEESTPGRKSAAADLSRPMNNQPAEASYGFAHPALSRPQQPIWIPVDQLGLGEEEVRGCREKGVDAVLGIYELESRESGFGVRMTLEGVMNEKGKADVLEHQVEEEAPKK